MSRVLATCRSLGSSPGWTKSAVSLRGSQTHTSLEPLVAIKSTRDLKVLGLSGLRMKLLWGCCCNGFGHASGACYDDELTFYHRGIILQQGSMGLVFLCCNRQRFGCIEQRPWAKSAEWNAMTWVKLNLTFWNSLWISAGVCIYIYLSICRGTCCDLSVEKCNSDSSKVMLPQTLASAPKSQAIVRSSKWHSKWHWRKYDKISQNPMYFFTLIPTWHLESIFYGHICKSLLSWSLFQATSARRPQRHDEKRCLLVGSTVCKQWSYVAAMSQLCRSYVPLNPHKMIQTWP